jgi:hypothetical protein
LGVIVYVFVFNAASLFPSLHQTLESPLKYQHRCVTIFKDKQNRPAGFALGSIEGRVAIQYINPVNPYAAMIIQYCVITCVV